MQRTNDNHPHSLIADYIQIIPFAIISYMFLLMVSLKRLSWPYLWKLERIGIENVKQARSF